MIDLEDYKRYQQEKLEILSKLFRGEMLED